MKAREMVMNLLEHIAECDSEQHVEFYIKDKVYIATYMTVGNGFMLKEVKEDAK